MGALVDLLKDIPLSAVLKEKIATFEAENASLKTEIAILKDDLRKSQAENKRLKDEIERLTHTDDLHEAEVKMLALFAQAIAPVTDDALSAEMALPLPKVEYYLQELVAKGYLEHFVSIYDYDHYGLTQKGRKYLIDNGLL